VVPRDHSTRRPGELPAACSRARRDVAGWVARSPRGSALSSPGATAQGDGCAWLTSRCCSALCRAGIVMRAGASGSPRRTHLENSNQSWIGIGFQRPTGRTLHISRPCSRASRGAAPRARGGPAPVAVPSGGLLVGVLLIRYVVTLWAMTRTRTERALEAPYRLAPKPPQDDAAEVVADAHLASHSSSRAIKAPRRRASSVYQRIDCSRPSSCSALRRLLSPSL